MTCVVCVASGQYTVEELGGAHNRILEKTYGGVSVCNDQVHVLNRNRELPLRDKRT
jgi:hypothetical protein